MSSNSDSYFNRYRKKGLKYLQLEFPLPLLSNSKVFIKQTVTPQRFSEHLTKHLQLNYPFSNSIHSYQIYCI